jgi:tRNA nucleotidyltransferase (CCA-adding enzyme)
MFEQARQIIDRVKTAGATEALLVGGFVRDRVMGLPSKDVDIEVYGLSYGQIAAALEPHHDVRFVGAAFGVLKVDHAIDVSLPRRESKTGSRHTDFKVRPDPAMTPLEACRRRDFTINSLAMTADGEILDFFGGVEDLRAGVLRATSPAFREDPLRVLRGVQFAGRFGLTMHPDTVAVCRQIVGEYGAFSRERVMEEWWKWAVKSRKPSRGLAVLEATGWDVHYPMLGPLRATAQDPVWHPEGNVWVHTLHVCDAAAEVAEREGLDEAQRAVLLFAALCHDLGKVTTTHRNAAGRWVAPEHAAAGVDPTQAFLAGIGAPSYLHEQVAPLVREHMAHLATPDPNDHIVSRLANRLGPSTIEMWSHVVEADHSGRPPKAKTNPVTRWVELAKKLQIDGRKPQPLLQGRYLLEMGWQPGPPLGRALKKAFEAQLDGAFVDETSGLEWVRTHADRFAD